MCFSYYLVHSEGRTVACVDYPRNDMFGSNTFVVYVAMLWTELSMVVMSDLYLFGRLYINWPRTSQRFLVLMISPYPSYLCFPLDRGGFVIMCFELLLHCFEWRGKLSRISHAYCYACFPMQFLYIYISGILLMNFCSLHFPMEFSFFVSRVY